MRSDINTRLTNTGISNEASNLTYAGVTYEGLVSLEYWPSFQCPRYMKMVKLGKTSRITVNLDAFAILALC